MKTLPGTLTLPPRTVAGIGTSASLIEEAEPFGPAGVIVHGASLARSGGLQRILDQAAGEMTVRLWCHPGGEPTLEQVQALIQFLNRDRTDWVAAVGGGSVLDVAKAATGLKDAPLAAPSYHQGADIPPANCPFVAVPTTAGTGSEATFVSVLTDAEKRLKKSIRHPSHMARTVILDGNLLASCPPAVIAASGLDALTQGIEAYISKGATWLTDQLALKAVRLVARTLEPVFTSGGGDERQSLLEGSYLAGLALSNARLGLVHGLAHPLGARFKQPHGLACAFCLPHVLQFNRPVITEKYDRLCEAVGGDLLSRVAGLLDTFGLDNPFAGVSFSDMDAIVEETLASGSTRANPRDVNAGDVREILTRLTGKNLSSPGRSWLRQNSERDP